MKYRVLVIMVCVVAMCASTSLALTRMGAPAGTLGAGKANIGFDYTYARQNIDVKESKLNGVKEADPSGTIKRVDMQTGAAKLGYGLVEAWDIYGILGGVEVDVDNVSVADGAEFAPSVEFMYGFGTKFTFWQGGDLKLGALGQVDWVDGLNDSIDKAGGVKTEISADIMEAQIAVGPTYKPAEGIWIYGGPFMHMLSGNVEAKSTGGAPREREADIEQASQFGVYIGAEAAIGNSTTAAIEYQHTTFADAIGVNITFGF